MSQPDKLPASRRELDFSAPQQVQNPLTKKLNEASFPKLVGISPHFKPIQSGQHASTPISQMMELTAWQDTKIRTTFVNRDLCANNLVSDKLFQVLEVEDIDQQREFSMTISPQIGDMINRVLMGLAKNQASLLI